MGKSSDEDDKDDRRRRRRKKKDRRSKREKDSKKRRTRSETSSDEEVSDRNRRKRKKKEDSKKKAKKRSSSDHDSSLPSSSSSSSDSSSREEERHGRKKMKVVVNERLLAKLEARGETLEERKERRAQKRAAHISSKFGYTPEENPFRDPNLHETFVWKKRQEKATSAGGGVAATLSAKKQDNTLEEIEKVRKRRKDRELQFTEMERIRAEESRMKELENYDDWARKEEEFHLQQQRQRSAIRLIEGREKPIDVLAKNVLLFGLTEEEKLNRSTVKYKERFNALEELENLEAVLDEPQYLLKMLKLNELEELLIDIEAFLALEREACACVANSYVDVNSNPVLRYWNALYVIAQDEIKLLQTGGAGGSHAKMVTDVQKIFKGQSKQDLVGMQREVQDKIRRHASTDDDGGAFDREYWKSVDEQLTVYPSKMDLTEIHNQMLVRQLERLEKRREELSQKPASHDRQEEDESEARQQQVNVPANVDPDFGNVEEELGMTHEIELKAANKKYSWQDKFRPRKPRYFNRVKTGYDWNKYNQTHYDKDTPPPKVVQGYKFNIFYPDLIDPTKTPQFYLEPADSDEFCIIRFHAGPPYEDVAFKIINREWNRSRKQGYKCTFERGVLSLYFNFMTHWYRR